MFYSPSEIRTAKTVNLYSSRQGCTNPGHNVVATALCTVARNICGSPACKWFVSSFRRLEFGGGSEIFGKFVHLCLNGDQNDNISGNKQHELRVEVQRFGYIIRIRNQGMMWYYSWLMETGKNSGSLNFDLESLLLKILSLVCTLVVVVGDSTLFLPHCHPSKRSFSC